MQIAQAKHDLAHVNATLKILDASNSGNPAYIVSQGFFAKGEIAATYQRHLTGGPLNTRELAERAMGEKGFDVSDTPLRNSVVYKVVQARGKAQCGADGRTRCAGRPGDSLSDVFDRLISASASAALEAAFLGSGPLACLLGGGGGGRSGRCASARRCWLDDGPGG